VSLHYLVKRSIRVLQENGNETRDVVIVMHLKFFTYTRNAVIKNNSNINIYNINNNKMQKVIFESFTCFVT